MNNSDEYAFEDQIQINYSSSQISSNNKLSSSLKEETVDGMEDV
jgi:hypothetical protein